MKKKEEERWTMNDLDFGRREELKQKDMYKKIVDDQDPSDVFD